MDRLKELKIDRTEKGAGKSGGGFLLGMLAALLVFAGGASWFWYTRTSVTEVKTAAVERAVERAASETVLDASGYVTARRRATVSSKVTGKIVEVLVEEGMVIAEGQLLARLDDASQSRQLALVEAELASARSSLAESEVRLREAALALERTRQLVAGAVSSQAALDSAQAAHDAIEARLAVGREQVTVAERRREVARQAPAATEIRAPSPCPPATTAAPPAPATAPLTVGGFTRTGICTLVDMSSLEIEVDVNEAYIKRVLPNQRVRAVLDAYPDWEVPASVITTVPTADRQRATVRVRIAFDELDSRMLPDMGVKVAFLGEEEDTVVSESSRPRLFIPAAALRQDGDQAIVFVLRGETLERRAIGVGAERDGRVEVEAGLEGGDRVVVEASGELADGLRVVER